MLQKRIKDIQGIIDKHFEMIKQRLQLVVEEKISKRKRKQAEMGQKVQYDFKSLE